MCDVNMKTKTLYWHDDLKNYLRDHEDDIYHGNNDFGELKTVFHKYFGRPAKPYTTTTSTTYQL